MSSMLGEARNTTGERQLVFTRHIVYITLSGSSLLLNGTFLAVLWKSWTVVKRKRITYYVTNLSLADTLLGATTCAHFLLHVNGSQDTPLNKTLVLVSWTATLTSLLAVCLMAVERTLLVTKPHNWMRILPTTKIRYLLTGSWLLTLPLALLMYFHTLVMRFVLLVLFYVPVLGTSVLYSIVYKTISKATTTTRYNNDTEENSALADNERKVNVFQRKVGNFVRLLTVVLLVTVVPSFACLIIQTASQLFETKFEHIDTITNLSFYFYMLELSNLLVNPFLYVWRIHLYRKAFWNLFNNNW